MEIGEVCMCKLQFTVLGLKENIHAFIHPLLLLFRVAGGLEAEKHPGEVASLSQSLHFFCLREETHTDKLGACTLLTERPSWIQTTL